MGGLNIERSTLNIGLSRRGDSIHILKRIKICRKGSGQNARATVARAFCPEPLFQFMMALKCQSIREAIGRFIFTKL